MFLTFLKNKMKNLKSDFLMNKLSLEKIRYYGTSKFYT